MKREFNKPPVELKEKAGGIIEAIEATKRKIEQYKTDGADTSELDKHLEGLELGLAEAEKELKK